jgi:hypothetical protein
VPVVVTIPAALRDILLHQNTSVQFQLSFNLGGPGLSVDRLHFSGTFNARSVSPRRPSARRWPSARIRGRPTAGR